MYSKHSDKVWAAAGELKESLETSHRELQKSHEKVLHAYKTWEDTRRENLTWLDNAQKIIVDNNAGEVAATTAVLGTASTVGIGVVAGVLAPFTMGISLLVGAAAGAATAGISAGGGALAGVSQKRKADRANTVTWDEMLRRLKKDNDELQVIKSAIGDFVGSAKETINVLKKIDVDTEVTISALLNESFEILRKTIHTINLPGDMPRNGLIADQIKEKATELKDHESVILYDVDRKKEIKKIVGCIDKALKPMLKYQ